MKAIVAGAAALLLAVATPAFAHRIDAYLQATTVSVERDRVVLQMRLVPGVEAYPAVIALIDTDRDGAVTEAELRAYAARVARDLSLSLDGRPLALRVVSAKMEDLEALKGGRGTIGLTFDAAPPSARGERTLVLENHHQAAIAEYLVNALVSRDDQIRLGAQHRSYDQSQFRLDFVDGVGATSESVAPRAATYGWLGAIAVLLLVRVGAARWRARSPVGAG